MSDPTVRIEPVDDETFVVYLRGKEFVCQVLDADVEVLELPDGTTAIRVVTSDGREWVPQIVDPSSTNEGDNPA